MSFVYFISSDKIGSQDPELGQKLMSNFFIKVLEASEKPSHILFVERGVKLLLPDSYAIDALKLLEKDHGVEIRACLTCLEYYDIKESMEVGKITGMADIIATMHESDKVIHI